VLVHSFFWVCRHIEVFPVLRCANTGYDTSTIYSKKTGEVKPILLSDQGRNLQGSVVIIATNDPSSP
jgi:hypothetical protein